MLYVLYGSDSKKSREKVNALIETLISRKPNAHLIRIDSMHFDVAEVLDHIDSQGLFEERSIIVLDNLLQEKDSAETIIDALPRFQSSQNVFVLLESGLDAKTVKKIEKHAEKIQKFEQKEEKQKKDVFNIFTLSDALGERNRKKLWTLYQTGKLHNVSDEEMHGILFWSVKNMLLAQSAKSAQEVGLSPFVFKKSQRFAGNYSREELLELSAHLVEVYHDARRGKTSFDVLFEQLLLNQRYI